MTYLSHTKTLVLLSALSVFSATGAFCAEPYGWAKSPVPAETIGHPRSSGVFIENKGQWDSHALFLSQTRGLNFWITQDGPVFDFNKFVPTGRTSRQAIKDQSETGYAMGHVVKMSFLNTRPSAVTGGSELIGKYNYFMGRDQAKWVTNARSYTDAVATQTYEGVSVHYSIDQGAPRYDLIVEPGADPSQVRLQIEGADDARVLPNGNLELSTSLGNVEERGLIAYQETDAGHVQVPCRMVLEGTVAHFDLGSYDTSKSLVIDPLVASTFLGGSYDLDSANCIALDSSNDIYTAGQTWSTDFPVTLGAYQRRSKGLNAFVTKLSPAEQDLIYSTYLGGSGGEACTAIAVDSKGDAFVAGWTYSTDFPTTKGVLQGTDPEAGNTGFYPPPGQATSGFVTRLNSSGSGLLYSTYLGGSGENWTSMYGYKICDGDEVNALAIDDQDNAYLAGFTCSQDFPVTKGAFQTVNTEFGNVDGANTGASTAFLAKLDPLGTTLRFATYLGGNGESEAEELGEAANALAVDKAGNVYLGGYTNSIDFPISSNALEKANYATYNNGDSDGFVVELNSSGSAMVYGTYLGGTYGSSQVNSLAVDPQGNFVVSGFSDAEDFPIVGGLNGTGTVFVAKFQAGGAHVVYSTSFGGSGNSEIGAEDIAYSLVLDGAGNPIIVGQTFSHDFPTTAGAFETTGLDSDNGEGFLTKLSSSGSSILYSSYLGGSIPTSGSYSYPAYCSAVSVNSKGQAVIAGYTNTTDFPTTSGAFDTSFASIFVSTLSLSSSGTEVAGYSIDPSPVTGGNPATAVIDLTNSLMTETTFALTFGNRVSGPASVSIPAGAASASFRIETQFVSSPTMVELSAKSGALSVSYDLTILPPAMRLLTIRTPCLGGETVSGSIGTTARSGPNGGVVLLATNSADAAVPESVTIPTGRDTASFYITTRAVSTLVYATITATYGNVSRTALLKIEPPAISSFEIVPASVVGGKDSDGVVRLAGKAALTGDVIKISSSSASVTVPSSVTVPASQTAVSFPIKTKAVKKAVNVTITLTFGSSATSKTLTLSP